MKNTSQILAASALSLALVASSAFADISVNLNGQPLATAASPMQVNGRTLVPMRDIFEALGAQLEWNPVAQTITAQKDLTRIQLAINNPDALVNNRSVRLEQPATLVNGRTYVPLRFVAEATGAQVEWNGALQLVSIRSNGNSAQNPVIAAGELPYNPNSTLGGPTTNTQVAAARTISVPDGAVVPTQIDQTLSSATARVGQIFTASVVSRRLGDSEFPAGTKIEGRVTEARPSQNNQPGVLDLEWTGAILPDGTRLPIRGQLTALDETNVQMTGGRIIAPGAREGNDLKIIGVGAGAGFVLGRVLGTNSTVTTILGAAGGYLLGKSRDRKAQEAVLSAKSTLGVRLDDAVRYADTTGYADYRTGFLRVGTEKPTDYDPNYYGYDTSASIPRDDAPAPGRYADYEYANQLPLPAPTGNRNPIGIGDVYAEDVNGAQNGQQVAGYQQISIPNGAVVPVTIDQELSSASSTVGQTFTASVESQRLGDSEFPAGTKISGRVIEARPQQGIEPGTLDLEFQTAILPDGTRIPLSAELISLDDQTVQTQGGRIVAKSGAKSKNDRLKVIGIGTAAGFVIGRVLKKDGLLPSLLGALGGYLYGAKAGDKPAQAKLEQGARIGVRLTDGISYRSDDYAIYRTQYLRQ